MAFTWVSIALAAVYVALGVIIGRLVSRFFFFVDKEFVRMHASSGGSFSLRLPSRFVGLVRWAIYILFIYFALSELGVSVWVARIFVLLVLFYVLLYLAIRLKDFVVNWLAFLRFGQQSICVDDIITVNGVEARVTRISRTALYAETEQQDVLEVPASFAKHFSLSVQSRKKAGKKNAK